MLEAIKSLKFTKNQLIPIIKTCIQWTENMFQSAHF